MINKANVLFENDRELLKLLRSNGDISFFKKIENTVKENTGRFCCDVA